MQRIEQEELSEIIKSYGLDNLVFDSVKDVEPDLSLYFFHDPNHKKYVLIVADYLGGYETINLPHKFTFDFYENASVEFTATKLYSYVENAPKAATNHIDDGHYLTEANTGDVCMLYQIKF